MKNFRIVYDKSPSQVCCWHIQRRFLFLFWLGLGLSYCSPASAVKLVDDLNSGAREHGGF